MLMGRVKTSGINFPISKITQEKQNVILTSAIMEILLVILIKIWTEISSKWSKWAFTLAQTNFVVSY